MELNKPFFTGGTRECPLSPAYGLIFNGNGHSIQGMQVHPLEGGVFRKDGTETTNLMGLTKVGYQYQLFSATQLPDIRLSDPLIPATLDVELSLRDYGVVKAKFFLAGFEFVRGGNVLRIEGATWEAGRNAWVAFGKKGSQKSLQIVGADLQNVLPRLVPRPSFSTLIGAFGVRHAWSMVADPGNPFAFDVPEDLSPDAYLTLGLAIDEGKLIRQFEDTVRVIEGEATPNLVKEQLDRIEADIRIIRESLS